MIKESNTVNIDPIDEKKIINSKNRFKISGVFKSFPGIQALDDINLEFFSGEVYALVGENGAGKSTLVKIICGVYSKDSGELLIDDQVIDISNPRVAASLGISVIHQEFSLFPELNVAQNIFLGMELTNVVGFKLNKAEMHKKTRELLARLNLDIDTKSPVKLLSVAEQQSVEIAKALVRDSWFFIMDEPTSALSEAEKNMLFKIIKRLKDEGAAIIYISHHLGEIFEVADKVTVLRDGKVVGTYGIDELSEKKIANLMVGKEIASVFSRKRRNPGKDVLELRNLTKNGAFEGVSFTVREGEVIGLSGLIGSGCTELCKSIYGLENFDGGDIYLNGKKIKFRSPLKANKAGVMYVSDDRRRDGIIPLMPVDENLTLMSLYWISFLGWIRNNIQVRIARELIERLSIKVSSIFQKVTNLSGGNQQKVVIGKCLTKKPRVLILNEPTRGIDIGAKEEVHKIIEDLANNDVAIIMISSELPELIGISDRILAFKAGRIVKSFTFKEADQKKILESILGTA